jgi:hypothetical protein
MSVAAWGFAGTAASAPVPGLAIDPTGGSPLTTLKITGQGFCKPGPTCGPVSITIAYVQVDSSRLTWTSPTMFTGFVRVPGSARPGADPVIAQQTVDGKQVTARTAFNVATGVPAPTSYTTPPSLQPPGGFPATTANRSVPTTAPSATVPPARGGTSTSIGPRKPTTSTTRATTTTTAASRRAVAENVGHQGGGKSNRVPWLVLALVVAAVILAGAWFVLRRRQRQASSPTA